MSDPAGGFPPRYTPRLSDKLLIAFHQACDRKELRVAELLIEALEIVVSGSRARTDREQKRREENLIAAHERLWHLKNAGQEIISE